MFLPSKTIIFSRKYFFFFFNFTDKIILIISIIKIVQALKKKRKMLGNFLRRISQQMLEMFICLYSIIYVYTNLALKYIFQILLNINRSPLDKVKLETFYYIHKALCKKSLFICRNYLKIFQHKHSIIINCIIYLKFFSLLFFLTIIIIN